MNNVVYLGSFETNGSAVKEQDARYLMSRQEREFVFAVLQEKEEECKKLISRNRHLSRKNKKNERAIYIFKILLILAGFAITMLGFCVLLLERMIPV